MSIALYRKYRPKTFAEVTNQNHIKVTVQNELTTDKLAHAYLFCGPRGTGKTTMARLVAKAANCTNLQPQGEPCNACPSCVDIMESKSMDMIEVDAASHTGVDNVRENIINNARFTPVSSKYKVFIIDEVHMLSTSAFNALLKILEEPPAHILFILATTEVHKVPVTIISRCQRFDFKKIGVTELTHRLQWVVAQEHAQVSDDVLTMIAKHAGGCVRDAESLLEQLLSLGTAITVAQASLIIPQTNTPLLIEFGELLFQKNGAQAIELVNRFVDDGGNVLLFTDHFVEWLRVVMVYRVTNSLAILHQGMDDQDVQRVVAMAATVDARRIAFMIQVILEKKQQFRQSPIAQLPLEVAIVTLTAEAPAPMVVVPPVARNPVVPVETRPMAPTTPAPVMPTVDKIAETRNNSAGSAPITTATKAPDVNGVPVQTGIVKTDSGITLTFSQITNRWPSVLQMIKEKNYALGMSLSVAKPVSLQGSELTLGFLFDLQRARVDNPVNQSMLMEVLATLFGTPLSVKTLVDATLTLQDIATAPSSAPQSATVVEQQETVDPVKQAMNVFGGSLVDGVG